MTKVSDSHHLLHRNGRRHYRGRAPSELASLIGKAVIKYSPVARIALD
jgi:hypothetical protein